MIASRGVKFIDQICHEDQLDWLMLEVRECPDLETEAVVISRHFRVPHPPAENDPSFVEPVTIRRTSRRVLFRQRSGIVVQ